MQTREALKQADWAFLFERICALKQKLRDVLRADAICTPEDLASASEYASQLIFEFWEIRGELMRSTDPELFRSFLACHELKYHLEQRASKRLYSLDRPAPAPTWGPIELQTLGALRSRMDRIRAAMLGAERIHEELGEVPTQGEIAGFIVAIEKIDKTYEPIRNVQLALEELRELRERWLDLRISAERLAAVHNEKAPLPQ